LCTPQFARITKDIPGFLDQVVTETNLGYANSEIPLRIKIHCVEEATIDDDPGDGYEGINRTSTQAYFLKLSNKQKSKRYINFTLLL